MGLVFLFQNSLCFFSLKISIAEPILFVFYINIISELFFGKKPNKKYKKHRLGSGLRTRTSTSGYEPVMLPITLNRNISAVV